MVISFCDINTICETVTIFPRYNHLKEEQRVVIISFLLGSNVFMILTTGFGKIVYQISLIEDLASW